MNKTQLINAIRHELGANATIKAATEALNATLAAITKAVATEKVQIQGFGTFETKTRTARIGRNPATGETVNIPAASVVAFKPSATLKGHN
ncbi:MAG: HU family DNA-binding protein [Akkermansiaceae bacterium]|nr:HU family DNA-binding protein [Akkermansiaceae bacterium]